MRGPGGRTERPACTRLITRTPGNRRMHTLPHGPWFHEWFHAAQPGPATDSEIPGFVPGYRSAPCRACGAVLPPWDMVHWRPARARG